MSRGSCRSTRSIPIGSRRSRISRGRSAGSDALSDQDALYRLEYDATADEIVDVAVRLANRSRAFGKQVRLALWVGRILVALLVMAAWTFWGQIPASPVGWALLIAGGVIAGGAFGYFFKGEFEKQLRKQHRRVIVEALKDGSTMPCELELRPGGVWVRQQGLEMTFPWSQSAGMIDTGNDIEIAFNPLSLVVVRNRYFSSPAERQRFLDRARTLAAPAG